jgi:ClpP class serine protease
MFKAMDSIRNAKKPVRSVVTNTAASAAFGLASQASGGLYAESRAAMFGSVGVAATMFIYPEEVEITSTEAPNKRPDVTTEEGKAVVREELDALHDLFVEGIAAGRKTTPEKVNKNFGRGSTLLADAALKNGMIDGILTTKQENKKAMDINELKAQHSELYSAVKNAGVAEERDRVTAHLTMGTASGDMDTAVVAITEGTGMTLTLQAKYMTAGRNKTDLDGRSQDAAAVVIDPAATVDPKTDADKVAALVAENFGVEIK